MMCFPYGVGSKLADLDVNPPVSDEMVFIDPLSSLSDGMFKELRLDQDDTFVLMLSEE